MQKRELTRHEIEGIEAYAQADRSDPFARARAYTHARNGITGYLPNGETAHYGATEHQETRTMMRDGVEHEYKVTTYRNVTRP